MALKDWMKKGEDWYNLKAGRGEIWMSEEKREVTPLGSPCSFIATKYVVYHSYLGDGGHPDVTVRKTKAEAHKFLMNHVRKKDY